MPLSENTRNTVIPVGCLLAFIVSVGTLFVVTTEIENRGKAFRINKAITEKTVLDPKAPMKLGDLCDLSIIQHTAKSSNERRFAVTARNGKTYVILSRGNVPCP